jgi:hypothetical protein
MPSTPGTRKNSANGLLASCLAGNAIRYFDSMLTISIGQKRSRSFQAYFRWLRPSVDPSLAARTVDCADSARYHLGSMRPNRADYDGAVMIKARNRRRVTL